MSEDPTKAKPMPYDQAIVECLASGKVYYLDDGSPQDTDYIRANWDSLMVGAPVQMVLIERVAREALLTRIQTMFAMLEDYKRLLARMNPPNA